MVRRHCGCAAPAPSIAAAVSGRLAVSFQRIPVKCANAQARAAARQRRPMACLEAMRAGVPPTGAARQQWLLTAVVCRSSKVAGLRVGKAVTAAAVFWSGGGAGHHQRIGEKRVAGLLPLWRRCGIFCICSRMAAITVRVSCRCDGGGLRPHWEYRRQNVCSSIWWWIPAGRNGEKYPQCSTGLPSLLCVAYVLAARRSDQAFVALRTGILKRIFTTCCCV